MLILEELNSLNLKAKTDNVIEKLHREIEKIRSGDERKITEQGTKELMTLVGDFQELVQIARNSSLRPLPNNIRSIALKIDNFWTKTIYPLTQEYNSEVDEYNKVHVNKLPHISKRTKKEVYKSVQTYFPY